MYCAAGDLRVVGSSAFAPTSAAIADGYRADCGEATFTSAMAGSLEGVRELRQASAEDRSRLVAFSDGGAAGELLAATHAGHSGNLHDRGNTGGPLVPADVTKAAEAAKTVARRADGGFTDQKSAATSSVLVAPSHRWKD